MTGSGKTEVYLRWMEETLRRKADGQILFLVPEINLTPQSVDRIRSRFPERTVAVLHSELSDGERARNWLAVHEGRADILVGTRTAVFASFKHLALVIVDEEHDGSYKAGDGLRFPRGTSPSGGERPTTSPYCSVPPRLRSNRG